MAWPKPIYSKNRVRSAGKAILYAHKNQLSRSVDKKELDVATNWREAHGAVLNTAQAWLRKLEDNRRPVVGQRLKRFSTILDKINTERSKDLSTMNDIAGVRAIFRSESSLNDFREKMFKSRAKHSLIHDESKFDYISNPKSSGYRGIHQVYARYATGASGTDWNGLRFEVQLRTAVQHAWATAIEVYDSTQHARFKFEESNNPAFEQFLVISEIFARVHEKRQACLSDFSDTDLVNQYRVLEDETQMVSMIESLNVADNYGQLQKNTILQRKLDGELYVYKFQSFLEAVRTILKIEDDPETANAVLVGANTPNHIRDAFRNYFDDTKDFVVLLNAAIDEIGN